MSLGRHVTTRQPPFATPAFELWLLHSPNTPITHQALTMSQLHIKNISLDEFNNVLSRYPSAVPDKLQELDTLRYDAIPAKVAERQDTAYLTKDEVEKLVEWKLYVHDV